jgi:hypothetical protein
MNQPGVSTGGRATRNQAAICAEKFHRQKTGRRIHGRTRKSIRFVQ